MTDNTSLEPCPFCGGDELSHGWEAPGMNGSPSTGIVQCHSCNALVFAEPGEAEAIAAWNQREKPAVPDVREAERWQPIETAPKDGTAILAWCVHPYASSMTQPEEYVGPVIARWIEHNNGGWTWHGHLGNFTHWQPLPEPPATAIRGADQ